MTGVVQRYRRSDLVLLLAGVRLRREPAEELPERLWRCARAGARTTAERRLCADDVKAVRTRDFRDGICRRCTRNAEAGHSPIQMLRDIVMQCSLSVAGETGMCPADL